MTQATMTAIHLNRRDLIKASALASAALATGVATPAAGFKNPSGRPRVGVVGCGSRWDQRATFKDGKGRYGLGKEFPAFSDIVAVCDVDSDRRGRGAALVKDWLKKQPDAVKDYRKILERKDIDIVHVSTPDHWHAKVAIEAMLAGKDVYCEKPMTLTIDEGKKICEVCKKTGRIFQVGTQQRSMRQMLTAIALIREGRLGTIKNVQCAVGGGPVSPKLPAVQAPANLDWNMWVGPAQMTSFRSLAGARNETRAWSNSHYEFRWWYEFSGGKLTDWGAHHVDIATWGMGKEDTGPVSIDPVLVEHPVEFKDGQPQQNDRYNTAVKFNIKATYADGMELVIRHDTANGILFEGTAGRIFVNRGRLSGKPVEDLATNPLPDGAIEKIYNGRKLTSHLANFFQAVVERKDPVSDVYSHHRALSTCHLAAIAARVGRKIAWDPKAERVVNDDAAQALIARQKRKGFEIEM